MKSAKFIYDSKVKHHHIDLMGHMNNMAYFTLLEEARWDVFDQHGFGPKDIQETQIGPVLLETHVKFRREMHMNEKIKIESQVEILKKNRLIEFQQTIYKESGEVSCLATFLCGAIDMKKRRLIYLPEMLMKGLGFDMEEVERLMTETN